jgi:geranylgeranyl diphosphate synthase type II
MVTGQAADIEYEGAAVQTEDMLHFIHIHKTADMLSAAVLAGAHIAGADEKTLAALTLYSEKMGLLFQITDDILDYKGDPALMGKTLGKDMEQGKLTYASLLGLEGAELAAKQAAEEALAAISEIPGSGYLAATIENMLVRSN